MLTRVLILALLVATVGTTEIEFEHIDFVPPYDRNELILAKYRYLSESYLAITHGLKLSEPEPEFEYEAILGQLEELLRSHQAMIHNALRKQYFELEAELKKDEIERLWIDEISPFWMIVLKGDNYSKEYPLPVYCAIWHHKPSVLAYDGQTPVYHFYCLDFEKGKLGWDQLRLIFEPHLHTPSFLKGWSYVGLVALVWNLIVFGLKIFC
jgi:hypothetical protein